MPYQTDERLKSYLDTNQLHREQMCLAILSIDKRFSEARPRHPRGGPDGGRDIEAVFRQEQLAFGAVGFINQANDSAEQKKQIHNKFRDDLENALNANPAPTAFIFLTNVNLTLGEKDALISEAKKTGVGFCEIFDRERLRIALDSPDGFAIRFQYLSIPLSEEEQASFFARWGDDIQSVIATGFQRIENTLDRLLFLMEASNVLSPLWIMIELDRTYAAEEIGHFRAFCSMYLKEPKHEILSVLFGSSDKSERMRTTPSNRDEPSGIKYGISGGQWEQYLPTIADDSEGDSEEAPEKYALVRSSCSIGRQEVKAIAIQYDDRGGFIRLDPTLKVQDIDEATFVLITNLSLANKILGIHVFANEYKLLEVPRAGIEIDEEPFSPNIPVAFSDDELSDKWVRICPTDASAFQLSFSDQTPSKMFSPKKTPNSMRIANTTSNQ